jgi:hypothetical protein
VEWWLQKLNPQSNPQFIGLRRFSYLVRQELSLRRPCFIAVFLRIKVQSRLDLRMSKKSKPLALFDCNTGADCRRPQVVGDET